MLAINKVITAERIDSNQFLITYQAGQDLLTMVISRKLAGWSARFHVLIKASQGTTEPDFVYHDSEPTTEQKEFWEELGSFAWDQKSEAFENRTQYIRKLLN